MLWERQVGVMPSAAVLAYTLIILECLLFVGTSFLVPEGGSDILWAVVIAHLVGVVAACLLYLLDRHCDSRIGNMACVLFHVILSLVLISWAIHKLEPITIWIAFFSWRRKDSRCNSCSKV